MTSVFDPTSPTVFISYCWKYRSEDVRSLAECLRKTKRFNVWIDTQQMHGSTIEKMSEGIDAADVVILCLCNEYKNSDNCKKEAIYADQQKKTLLPLRLQPDFKLGDWLGFVVGDRLWIDFKQSIPVQEVTDKIAEEALQLVDQAQRSKGFRVVNVNGQLFVKSYKKLSYENVRKAVQSQQKGMLVIKGEEGVGKTHFMSLMLLDQANKEFFSKECNYGVALWLNCYQWKDEMRFDARAKTTFRDELLKLVKAATKRPLINELDQQIELLMDVVKTPPIFIFDDVFHFPLLMFINELLQAKGVPCVCITRLANAAAMQLANSAWWQIVGAEEELSRWTNRAILELLRDILKCKGDDTKLRVLADNCDGLPRRAVETVKGESASEDPNKTSKVDTAALAHSFNLATLNGIRDQVIDDETAFPELKFVDVPNYDNYFVRSEDEDLLRKGIWNVATNGEKGFFVIHGGGGMGKSTLIAHVLRDPKNRVYYQKHCNLQIVLWLNCYEWRDGFDGNKKAEREFLTELMKLGEEAEGSKGTGNTFGSLDKMLAHFAVKGKRILFLLDDVFHYTILDTLRMKCKNIICCAVTRDASILQEQITFSPFLKCQGVPNPCLIGHLSDERVVEILKSDFQLKDKLSEEQLSELAKRSFGMPLIVNLIGGRFRNCRNFARTFNDTLENCNLGSLKIGKTGRGEKTASQLFETTLKQLDDDLRRRYYAFLLWNPVNKIYVYWLWGLWATEDEDEALELCETFERLSLVRHGCDERGSHYFSIHQILHETASSMALNDFNLPVSRHPSKLRAEIFFDTQRNGPEVNEAAKLQAFFRGIISRNFMLRLFMQDVLCPINPDTFDFLENMAINTETENVDVDACLLRLMSRCGQYYLAKLFLTSDTVNRHEFPGVTALMKACSSGHSKVVRLLLDNAADVNLRPGSETALMVAHYSEDPLVWDYLLGCKDINVNARSQGREQTALMIALSQGRFKFARRLLESGLDVDIEAKETVYDETAMHFAVFWGDVEGVKLLLDHKANVNAPCQRFGVTPLMMASTRGQVEIVKFLLENGSDVEARNDEGDTALLSAVRYFKYPGKEVDSGKRVVECLLEKGGANVDATNSKTGESPLMLAAKNGDADAVEILLRFNADKNLVDSTNHQTALDIARENNHSDIIKLLT